jgi:hypothetical protein
MDIDVTIITSSVSMNIRDVFIPLPSRHWSLQYVSFSSRIIFYSPVLSRTSSKSTIRALLKYDFLPCERRKIWARAGSEELMGGFAHVAKHRAFPESGCPAGERVVSSSFRTACSTTPRSSFTVFGGAFCAIHPDCSPPFVLLRV